MYFKDYKLKMGICYGHGTPEDKEFPFWYLPNISSYNYKDYHFEYVPNLSHYKITHCEKIFKISQLENSKTEFVIGKSQQIYICDVKLPPVFNVGDYLNVLYKSYGKNGILYHDIYQIYHIDKKKLYITKRAYDSDINKFGFSGVLDSDDYKIISHVDIFKIGQYQKNDDEYVTMFSLWDSQERFICDGNYQSVFKKGDCVNVLYKEYHKNNRKYNVIHQIYHIDNNILYIMKK